MHHPTRWIEATPRPRALSWPQGMLSVGCALLGASHVLALELDTDALQQAVENVEQFDEPLPVRAYVAAERGGGLRQGPATMGVCCHLPRVLLPPQGFIHGKLRDSETEHKEGLQLTDPV